MLARHAEDLFWIGRYLERAEDTARMLDVTYHSALESKPDEAQRAWRDLLESLHLGYQYPAKHGSFTGEAVTEYLVLDDKNPGSIISAVSRARVNARSLRERIPTEFWEAINSFHLELVGRNLRDDLTHQPSELYRLVRARCQMITGVASESMLRDDGWCFQRLGRALERAEMTCRLLSVRFAGWDRGHHPTDFRYWLAVLNSVSAFEAYVQSYHGEIVPVRVAELLVLSKNFPRSVLFCLQEAERELERVGPPGAPTRPHRLLGRLRASIEFQDAGELLDASAGDRVEQIQEEIWNVAQAIDDHYFARLSSTELHHYGAH